MKSTARAHEVSMAVLHTALHTAWADQRLAANEVSAARGVATVLGVVEEGRGLLATPPSSPSQLGLRTFNASARELAYATAVWMALADGILDTAECRFLNGLRDELALTPARCAELEDLVFAGCHGGDERWEGSYAAIVAALGAS